MRALVIAVIFVVSSTAATARAAARACTTEKACEKACKAAPAGLACVRLADLVSWQDPKRAVALRDASCQAGNARGCRAFLYSQGPDEQVVTLVRACTLGDAEACWLVKSPLAPNTSPIAWTTRAYDDTPYWSAALPATTEACKAGVAFACLVLSTKQHVVPWAKVRAQACALDTVGVVCSAADMMSELEPEVDVGFVARLAAICQLSDDNVGACSSAAFGLASAHQGAKAEPLFTRACKLGSVTACEHVAKNQLDAGKPIAAAKTLELCAGREAGYCLYFDVTIPIFAAARARAIAAIDAACDRGLIFQCVNAASALRSSDPERSAAFAAKACKLDAKYCEK